MKDLIPTACIIAGGKSLRFGSDKLLADYKGIPLIVRVVNTLKIVFKDIIIISGSKDKFPFTDIPVFPDIIPDAGPIGGLHSALAHSNTHKAFCFAGDMPNLDTDLIKYMISISDNYDIVVPRIRGFYEPMHAIYPKDCIKNIEESIPAGKYQMFNFFEKYNVRELDENEIFKFSSPEIIFKNINIIDDVD